MCFSAEASLGVAVVLLPAGAYCVETAWRKGLRYLPLAVVPILFGLQQLCEAQVWAGLGLEDQERARIASLGFLFCALALWPVWIPLAVATVEPRGWTRTVILILAVAGVSFGVAYFLPVATDGGRGLDPTLIGHSIRYDLSAVPATRTVWWWVWPALYLAAVCGPLLASRDCRLRMLGAAVVLSAAVSYALFEYVFVSVWCFCAAVLSLYLAYVLYRRPDNPPVIPEPGICLTPSR
jgi:hypothetical protein